MAVGPQSTSASRAAIDLCAFAGQSILLVPIVGNETVIRETPMPSIRLMPTSTTCYENESSSTLSLDATQPSPKAPGFTSAAVTRKNGVPHTPRRDVSQTATIATGANEESQVSRVTRCRWLRCSLTFQSLVDLVNHVNDVHVKVGCDVEYRCRWEGCPRNGRGFNARYKMLIHVRTHTNEKPHECSLCGKRFSRLENLKIHTRTHTGEKPYVCPVEGCQKAYSNSSDRFKHVRTHQTNRPYCCKMPGCDKHYTDPSSLRKHIRTNGHYCGKGSQLAPSSAHSANVKGSGNSLAKRIQESVDTARDSTAGGALQGQLLAHVMASSAGSSGTQPSCQSPMSPPSGLVTVQGSAYHISALSANPLLSSAVVTSSGASGKDTPQFLQSSSVESPISAISISPQPLISEHPQKNVFLLSPPDGADLEESPAASPRIQDTPLDLSTSPPSHSPSVCIVTEMEEVELVVKDGIVLEDPIQWELQVVQPD